MVNNVYLNVSRKLLYTLPSYSLVVFDLVLLWFFSALAQFVITPRLVIRILVSVDKV